VVSQRTDDAPPPTPPPGHPGPPPPPFDLHYFAANEPDRRRERAVVLCSTCLALGWVPYLCGIVNALVVAQSYSPAVVGAHRGGAVLFMGLGLVLTLSGTAGFLRLRQWTGLAAGALFAVAQVAVAACLGLSRV
jgi:hypothetical protein